MASNNWEFDCQQPSDFFKPNEPDDEWFSGLPPKKKSHHQMVTRGDVEQEKFTSVAEQVIKFHHKTPSRFHLHSAREAANEGPGPSHCAPAKLTCPETPQFATDKRFGKRVPAPVEPRPPKSDERPVTKSRKRGPTVPVSPAFQTGKRTRSAAKELELDNKKQATFYHPAPAYGVPFIPKKEHKKTVPVPFSFEDRDRQLATAREDKVKATIEAERRQAEAFRAQLMPVGSPDTLPERHAVPPTKPKPFNFKADERGDIHKENLQRKLEAEKEAEKARILGPVSPRVLRQRPFVPEPSSKPTTEPIGFELLNEQRGCERAAYDNERRKRNEEAAEVYRKQMEQENRREIGLIRKGSVHQARPIKQYKPVEVKGSAKPLTEPHSPKFSDRFKK